MMQKMKMQLDRTNTSLYYIYMFMSHFLAEITMLSENATAWPPQR